MGAAILTAFLTHPVVVNAIVAGVSALIGWFGHKKHAAKKAADKLAQAGK